jgi:hypothetical protein
MILNDITVLIYYESSEPYDPATMTGAVSRIAPHPFMHSVTVPFVDAFGWLVGWMDGWTDA